MPATNLPPTRSVNVSDYTPYIANPDGVDGSIHSNDPSATNNNTLGTGASVKLFNIALTTAGRFSFYIDYSELATTGTHTFYVQRTHGTVGAVSVDYATSGDAHTTTSGTLSWADGQAGIQSFEVVVPTKADAGDHRIVATLSNASGGAVLHHGAKTIAYGVIDDGTIASDADAVFYDSAATGGTGTQADPYGSIYTAIANVGAKRYLYLRGTMTPDTTNTVNPNGGGGIIRVVTLPNGRTSESNRLYIQNWPGSTFTLDGLTGTDVAGFYKNGNGSYITFKGLDFRNLNTTFDLFTECFGIGYFITANTDVNVEYCSFDNLDGGSNTAGFVANYITGLKMWRNTSNNTKFRGSNTNGNASGLCQYYGCANTSYMRNTVTLCGISIFAKRPVATDISPNVSFNILKGVVGLQLSFASANQGANYLIVNGNLFKDNTIYYGYQCAGSNPDVTAKNWIANNVFDNCGGGDNGAIYLKDSYDYQIFNNIMYNCRKVWDVPETVALQSNTAKNLIDYADFNQEFGTTAPGAMYEYLSLTYADASLLNAAVPRLAANDTSGDPLFTNPALDDYTLQVGSSAIATGVNATDKGIYLTGNEVVGA